MSASHCIQTSLIAFAALVGLSAAANAGPTAGSHGRGIPHGPYQSISGNAHGIFSYAADRHTEHFETPHYRRSRTPRNVGAGGHYRDCAYGCRGISRYNFHGHH